MTDLDWREALLSIEGTMADAIRVIDSAGLRIALVCESTGVLIGVVTDGDIRRALLRGQRQDDSIQSIMNAKPTTVRPDEDRDATLDLMQRMKLLHIPIVNDTGVLVGLETLDNLTTREFLENPVFLLAGGFGKRLHPLTQDIPKPLLKVGTKPILQTIIEQFLHYGFHRFFISTHYKAEMLEEHFGDGSGYGANIQYLHEDEPLGTAGGLGLLDSSFRQKPLIVMNGDLLTRLNFEQLLRFHESSAAAATMCVREYSHTIPYGVVDIDDNGVTRIEEKPARSYSVNAGVYVIGPEILQKIPPNTHVDMTTVLQSAIDKGGKVATFPIHEYWLDIGRMEDYERANNDVGTHF